MCIILVKFTIEIVYYNRASLEERACVHVEV